MLVNAKWKFQADFPKKFLSHTCNLEKQITSTWFGVEMLFKYQNNKQNLQIWDMQISQAAKF